MFINTFKSQTNKVGLSIFVSYVSALSIVSMPGKLSETLTVGSKSGQSGTTASFLFPSLESNLVTWKWTGNIFFITLSVFLILYISFENKLLVVLLDAPVSKAVLNGPDLILDAPIEKNGWSFGQPIKGEIYRYGNAYLWNLIVIPIVVIISCYTFLPVFYRTKSESVYTYLELRFRWISNSSHDRQA